MFADYLETVRILFRDAAGVNLEEAPLDRRRAQEEMRRAFEAGASEQEACGRLLDLLVED